jgi:hypothetical protein
MSPFAAAPFERQKIWPTDAGFTGDIEPRLASADLRGIDE